MKTTMLTMVMSGLLCGCQGYLHAQNAHPLQTDTQLEAFLPNEQDFQGCTRISPTGELGEEETFRNGRWTYQLKSAAALLDDVEQNVDLSQRYNLVRGKLVSPWRGHYSKETRVLFSADGQYRINITVWLCDSPFTAQDALDEYHANSSALYHPGTLSGAPQIGDCSRACAEYLPGKSLISRAGNVALLVCVGPTRMANTLGSELLVPDVAVEAIAYQVLLRASQQPQISGVSVQEANMTVNGHALPKNALLVAGQTYVPVAEFAKAMGMATHWNTKTGFLTLSGKGRKTVTLMANSTASSMVGGAKGTALTVPVLKQAGQPVMMLDDLLAVTGGHITSRSGNTVRVKG